MSDSFTMKRADRLSYLRRTLTDATNAPIDLGGTTVKFYMCHSITGNVIVDGVSADIIDSDNGVVEYQWQDGDTDTTGTYLAEFEVTRGGLIQTFPNDGYITVYIKADIR